jgi:hypothetical protein
MNRWKEIIAELQEDDDAVAACWDSINDEGLVEIFRLMNG